jgi:hypothetical protein
MRFTVQTNLDRFGFKFDLNNLVLQGARVILSLLHPTTSDVGSDGFGGEISTPPQSTARI